MSSQQKVVPFVFAAIISLGTQAFTPSPGAPEIGVLSTDNHSGLNDGVIVTRSDAKADMVDILDLSKFPPKLKDTIQVSGSVQGPPMAVSVARDGSFAIVTSSSKQDPQNPTKTVVDNRVSVIDLKSSPPRVVQQVEAGAGASSAAVSPDATLALVANRAEGTVSIYTVKNGQLQPVGKLDLGNPKSGPSGIRFLPDGKTALLTRDNDHMVSILHINGTTISIDPRPLTTGVKPYGLDITPDGKWAVVGNMGRMDGDMDTVSLIDLSQTPFRTVQTFSVASEPEGIKFSPDGKVLAVAAQDGSNKGSTSPFYHDHGTLFLYSMDGAPQHVKQLAALPVGKWNQGIAFSRDGSTIMVENMVERNLSVFRFQHGKLTAAEPLPVSGGAESIGTAW